MVTLEVTISYPYQATGFKNTEQILLHQYLLVLRSACLVIRLLLAYLPQRSREVLTQGYQMVLCDYQSAAQGLVLLL